MQLLAVKSALPDYLCAHSLGATGQDFHGGVISQHINAQNNHKFNY